MASMIGADTISNLELRLFSLCDVGSLRPDIILAQLPQSRRYIVTANSLERQVRIEESEPVKIDWYFDAVSHDEDDQLSVLDLANYIKGINAIIREGQYTILEKILHDSTRKKNISSQVLLVFARATFPVRTKISSWRRFLNRVASKLDAKGKDSSELLKGMN